jgi:hypothetical protein
MVGAFFWDWESESVTNCSKSGHLWKNSRRLRVGFAPMVLLASAEKSMREEFLTPHYSLVKPLIEEIKAYGT